MLTRWGNISFHYINCRVVSSSSLISVDFLALIQRGIQPVTNLTQVGRNDMRLCALRVAPSRLRYHRIHQIIFDPPGRSPRGKKNCQASHHVFVSFRHRTYCRSSYDCPYSGTIGQHLEIITDGVHRWTIMHRRQEPFASLPELWISLEHRP